MLESLPAHARVCYLASYLTVGFLRSFFVRLIIYLLAREPLEIRAAARESL